MTGSPRSTRAHRSWVPGRRATVAGSIALLAAIVVALVTGALTIAGFGPTIASAISAPHSAQPPRSTAAAPPVPAAPAATIVIGGFRYLPATLTVRPGTRITVRNTDTATLGLTARDGSFDTGEIPPGGTATITAPAGPGTYAYRCTVLPVLTGTLVVTG